MVTDLFEKQNRVLTSIDFLPIYKTLLAINGVAIFDSNNYNISTHRHFQLFNFNLEEYYPDL